jgi:TLD
MGNKPSKQIENHFNLKEKEILFRKRQELSFLKANDDDEFIEECWKSSQYLQIGTKWDFEMFLEKIKMPKVVEIYIQNDQRHNDIKTHLLTKQLLKGFWNNILNDSKMTDFSPSDTLLSNVAKFILQVEGDLKDPKWKLVYTSRANGNSWNSFAQSLEFFEESVLVVKDKDSLVFGAYKPSPFIPSPNFREEPNAFIFSLEPVKIFKPSGINHNHTYFNHGSKSGFPNGIGYCNHV